MACVIWYISILLGQIRVHPNLGLRIIIWSGARKTQSDPVWSGWRHCIPRTLHEDQPYIIGQEVTVSNGCPRNTPSSDYKISWELNRLIDNSHKLIVSQQNYILKIVNIYVFIKCPISSGNHYLKEHELITMLLKKNQRVIFP